MARRLDPRQNRADRLIRLLVCVPLCACRPEPAPPIQLVVGNDPTKRLTFSPESALAEYVEIPGSGNELRVTLAGYKAACEQFVAPNKRQALVTVTIVNPAGVFPTRGPYGWDGHPAHGGTATAPERPYSLPSARIGPKNFVFQPGGAIQLTDVVLERAGKVAGLLAFDFSGNAEREASSISGRFEAKICRLRRD